LTLEALASGAARLRTDVPPKPGHFQFRHEPDMTRQIGEMTEMADLPTIKTAGCMMVLS
jgi:hypothetical protein